MCVRDHRIISAAHHLDNLMKRPEGAEEGSPGDAEGTIAHPKRHICLIFSGGRPAPSSTDRHNTLSEEEAGEEEVPSEAAIMERCFHRLVLANRMRWRGVFPNISAASHSLSLARRRWCGR